MPLPESLSLSRRPIFPEALSAISSPVASAVPVPLSFPLPLTSMTKSNVTSRGVAVATYVLATARTVAGTEGWAYFPGTTDKAVLKAIVALGADRVCFGTDAPFQRQHVVLATYNAFLDGKVTEREKAQIMGSNIARLFEL